MYYLDTSVLMALYRNEPLSEAAERLLEETGPAPAISTLTQVETASVLARLVRTGELAEPQANEIEQALAADLDAHVLTRVPFHDSAWWQARYWLGQRNTTLRTLDALHFACVAEHNLTLATADHALARAAETLKVPAHHLAPK